MRLLLLPGLNGSHRLFAPLLPFLSEWQVTTLELPQQGPQDFDSLATELAGQLGDSPFVLLGESCSGSLAYRLALRHPRGLRGVIFAASFLRCPHPLLPWARYLPLPGSLLNSAALLNLLCVGPGASPALLELLRAEIRQLPHDLLRARLRSLSELQEPTRPLELPTLHLLPRQDRLVNRRAAALQQHCWDLQEVELDGPHFLLQSQPAACARAISAFMFSLEQQRHTPEVDTTH
jgi:surfactin synthase thioesterase subunit